MPNAVGDESANKFRDRVDVEETVLATFLDPSRRTFAQAFAMDATVDHNMSYMDAD